jgi:predicted anti-sigma-YlaC factor YlaD
MCLDDQILNTYLDGELVEPWKTQVSEHLKYCPACNARYLQLKTLHRMVGASRLADEQVEPVQEKILKFMEKNYLDKRRSPSFFHRNVKVGMPALVSVAAVVLVLLAGSLFLDGGKTGTLGEIIPQLLVPSQGSVVQVRATDSLSASKVLESFTLEQILQYLDSKGYAVDIRLKGIQPVGDIQTPVGNEEVQTGQSVPIDSDDN